MICAPDKHVQERGTRSKEDARPGRVGFCQRVGGDVSELGIEALRLLIQTGGGVVPRNSSFAASPRCFSLSYSRDVNELGIVIVSWKILVGHSEFRPLASSISHGYTT